MLQESLCPCCMKHRQGQRWAFVSRLFLRKLQSVNRANIKGRVGKHNGCSRGERRSRGSDQNFSSKLQAEKDHPTEQHLGEKNLLTFRSAIDLKKDNRPKDFSLQKYHFPFSSIITFCEGEKSDLLTHFK